MFINFFFFLQYLQNRDHRVCFAYGRTLCRVYPLNIQLQYEINETISGTCLFCRVRFAGGIGTRPGGYCCTMRHVSPFIFLFWCQLSTLRRRPPPIRYRCVARVVFIFTVYFSCYLNNTNNIFNVPNKLINEILNDRIENYSDENNYELKMKDPFKCNYIGRKNKWKISIFVIFQV